MPRLRKNASKKTKKKRVGEELRKFKKGTLRSSSGYKVKNRKQAIAIALSESGQSKRTKKRANKR
jgi:Family of unknown function (DUF6496)